MEDKQFLQEVREYIEAAELRFEGEWGIGRRLPQLIEEGLMPDLYKEVLRRIEKA